MVVKTYQFDTVLQPGQDTGFVSELSGNDCVPCDMDISVQLYLNGVTGMAGQVLHVQTQNEGSPVGICSFELSEDTMYYSMAVHTAIMGGLKICVVSPPGNGVGIQLHKVEIEIPEPAPPIVPPVVVPPIFPPIEPPVIPPVLPPVQNEYNVVPQSGVVVAHADCVLVCPQCNSKLIAHF